MIRWKGDNLHGFEYGKPALVTDRWRLGSELYDKRYPENNGSNPYLLCSSSKDVLILGTADGSGCGGAFVSESHTGSGVSWLAAMKVHNERGTKSSIRSTHI